MRAVILAAGEGTRLRPFTSSEPKVMLRVGNKPILQYVVESLVKNGITDISMVVGYHRQKIMSYFGNGDRFNADIDYINQWKQLGTAHALAQCAEEIEDEFLLLPGDNVISEETVSDLLSEREGCSVLITKSETPSKYGVITLKNGYVEDVVEKPEKSPSHLISTGIYSFTLDIFDYIEEAMNEQMYDLPSVVQKLMKDEDVKGIKTESRWIDTVYPWDLISVNSEAMVDVVKSMDGVVGENVIIKGPVKIGKGATIKGGSYIEGPAIIGEGSEIGPHACILPSTSIGEDSKVSPFTVIQNSILMQTVQVGPNSRIEDSVIGEGVKIGSGFSSFVDSVEKITEEGVQKLDEIGCMIASDTTIGSGVVTEPGVIIGNRCKVGSGNTIDEDIPLESRVV